MEAATTSAARVSRGLPLPGRRQRAAGERIAALFEEHGRMVYGVSRLLLRDPVEAEDAAQQTFLSAYRALLQGQEPRDPSAWLGTIARNECRSRLRARKAEPLALVQEPAGDELQRDVARHEEIQALCAALAELPAQQRDAVVLREFYGLSYAEVAAALGLSGAAVESLLFRARKRLQEQLRPVRSALGVLTLPVTLRDALAQALPGFGAGGASAGAGGAVLAKLASAPLAAKLAAATLAVGTVGTVAGAEQSHHAPRHRSTAPAHSHAQARAQVKPVAAAVRTQEPVTARPAALRTPAPVPTARESGHHGSSGGEVESEHRSAPTTTRTSGDGGGTSGGSGSGDTSHDGGGSSGFGSSGSGDAGSGGSGDRGATGESGHDGAGSGSGG
jgi:RNA polymerase sigma-70 factor (ECF subfamily)